jgi:hypothetical protein
MSTVNLSCPNCSQQIRAPQTVLGKQVRCKSCGDVFTARGAPAPAKGKPGKPTAAQAKKKSDDEEWGDQNPYIVTDLDLTPRCPHCAGEMEEGDVICLHCGYNVQTRVKAQTLKVVKTTFLEWVVHLAPGILFFLLLFPLAASHIYLWGAYRDVTFMPTLPLELSSQITIDIEKTGKDVDGWLWARIWGSVIAAGLMYLFGYMAFRRLVMNPKPPMKIKNK